MAQAYSEEGVPVGVDSDDYGPQEMFDDATSGGVTVKKGDTLWDIAKRELGDPQRWREIAKLNPQIKNPDLIHPGMVLKMPDGDGDGDKAASPTPNLRDERGPIPPMPIPAGYPERTDNQNPREAGAPIMPILRSRDNSEILGLMEQMIQNVNKGGNVGSQAPLMQQLRQLMGLPEEDEGGEIVEIRKGDVGPARTGGGF